MSEVQNITRQYEKQMDMKYGCNPNQKPAAVYFTPGRELPFEVLNGKPGYINYCDALNAWQLVKELKAALSLPSAASFKHVSPAGAAVSVELSELDRKVFDCEDVELSPLATAYVRARGADPLSSFGDFIALSEKVDVSTAQVIAGVISDGVIAPDYDGEALKILSAKKKGNYPVIKIDPAYQAGEMEYRDIFGITLAQLNNKIVLDKSILANIVTKNKDWPDTAMIDMIVATIAVKYTQSNSVGYGLHGQVIGLGAGQQSRVDCVKLAGRKVDTWYLRQHPKVLALPFKDSVKRQERVNARVRYIESDMTEAERAAFNANFTSVPVDLSADEKAQWLGGLKEVCLSSDAFFPFRDSIDQASKRGVKYLLQAGGSVREDEVISAADEYGMVMALSGIRLFHH